jgi:hypothetical protein
MHVAIWHVLKPEFEFTRWMKDILGNNPVQNVLNEVDERQSGQQSSSNCPS